MALSKFNKLLGRKVVSANVTTKSAIFTAPAHTIVTAIIVRGASATIAAIGGAAGVGFDAGSSNVATVAQARLATLTGATKATMAIPVDTTVGVQGDVLGIKFASAINATVTVEIFGYTY